jgi:hypothetical protein
MKFQKKKWRNANGAIRYRSQKVAKDIIVCNSKRRAVLCCVIVDDQKIDDQIMRLFSLLCDA